MKSDPAAAIADWPFTDEERKALLEGDVKRLYEWGTHPFLLAHFTRWGLFGLTPADLRRAHPGRARSGLIKRELEDDLTWLQFKQVGVAADHVTRHPAMRQEVLNVYPQAKFHDSEHRIERRRADRVPARTATPPSSASSR